MVLIYMPILYFILQKYGLLFTIKNEKVREIRWFRSGILLFHEFDCNKVEKATSNNFVHSVQNQKMPLFLKELKFHQVF